MFYKMDGNETPVLFVGPLWSVLHFDWLVYLVVSPIVTYLSTILRRLHSIELSSLFSLFVQWLKAHPKIKYPYSVICII